MQSSIVDGEISVILILDLSAAFNTIAHMILLDHSKRKIRISGVPLMWIISFLESGTLSVKVSEACSSSLSLAQGVSQRSIFSSLFILYMDKKSLIGQKHEVQVHVYADDTRFRIGF